MHFILAFIMLTGSVWARDRYRNFHDLTQAERAGVDYQVEFSDRSHATTILAIHGGGIEPGTSELTRLLANHERNFYLFEGIKPEHNWEHLHITSTHFDEPRALDLVAKSQQCVSFHVYINDSERNVCLGGLNHQLQRSVFQALVDTGVVSQNAPNPCGRYFARSPANIVNRCGRHGLQIEVSTSLMWFLLGNSAQMHLFNAAIESGLRKYEQAMNCQDAFSQGDILAR